MNTKNYAFVAIVAIILLATSCTKSTSYYGTVSGGNTNTSDTKTILLTKHAWELNDIVVNNKSIIKDCDLDDVLRFTTNTYEKYYNQQCENLLQLNENNHWKFIEHGTVIYVETIASKKFVAQYSIIKLDATSLILKNELGTTYSYSIN